MAHEIMEYDNMLSVHEVPWHGLGICIDDYIEPVEAQKLAGLTWSVRKEEIFYRMPVVNGMSRIKKVPNNYAVVRNDNNLPLGMVGEVYQPFQNDEMFSFMDSFCKETGSKIETCGSLRNGKIVWALSTNGEIEYIKNDPVRQYFLFKNTFDGSANIEICFTDVRVVCNNTLTAALRASKNMVRIRHTAALYDQVEIAKETFASAYKHSEKMQEVMQKLANVPLAGKDAENAIHSILLKEQKDIEALIDGDADPSEILTKNMAKTADKILELSETGAGTDIPGVKGTAYGLLQACTEYADHYKTIRAGERSMAEARFESLMMGSAQDFKQKAFDYFYAMAI